MNIHWAHPEALWLLVLVPVIMFGSIWMQRRWIRRFDKAFGPKIASFLVASYSRGRGYLRISLEGAALLFFLLAYAQPQVEDGRKEVKRKGVEIVICADVSQSMLAQDVRPDRLTQMKIELNRFLNLSSGDRIGLIAFAGSAILLSPLTQDSSAIRMYIDSLGVDSVMNQGTDFRRVLEEASKAFERGGVDTTSEESRVTRMILIASDGENHESKALEAARTLAGQGIGIYTLAFGSEEGGMIPQLSEKGDVQIGFKKDSSGKTVVSKVNVGFLEELAQEGKGSFYVSSPGGPQITSLREQINGLDQSDIEGDFVTIYAERFQIPLVAGWICALGALLLRQRRKEEGPWQGRYEVAHA